MFRKIGTILKWIGEHFKGLLFVLILVLLFLPGEEATLKPPNLQEIRLSGPIVSPDPILEAIEKARKDKRIKGVLLRVDSPGGAVAPSIEIARAVRKLNETKPVVAYAAGTMASGSYYSSIYARKIVANPGAIVGSIGVIMQSANIKPLMDKIGIESQTVKAGKYKEAGTPTRKWTPEERAELEKITQQTYRLFLSEVAAARHLDLNRSDEFADAHIFLGAEAKRVGLVDEVGTLQEARALTAKLAHVKDPVWKKKKKIEAFFEQFAQKSMGFVQSAFSGLQSHFYP